MRGKVIKLYDPNKKSEAKYNVLTGELIEEAEENNELSYDDVSNDNPIDEIDYISDEKIYKKDVNGIKGNKRFAAFILVSMIFLTLIVAMGLIFKHISFGKYENNKYIVAIRETYSFVYTVSGFVCAGIVLISSLTYLILMNKKYDAYYDYCYYKKANTKEELSLKQEARVYHIEKRLDKIVKFVTQEHRFTSVFLTVFYSLLSSIAGVIIACAIGNIWPKLYDAKELLENIIYMACSLVIPVVISLLIATFKKNKGFWIYLFITILAIGLSVGLAFVL